jgi:glutaredoxin
MAQAKGSVSGQRNEHQIVFYGLSTCIWCKRTRQFLEGEGVAFDFVYVDLLQGQERNDAIDKVRQYNPAKSFPTVVIDGTQCVVGYKKEELKEALGL